MLVFCGDKKISQVIKFKIGQTLEPSQFRYRNVLFNFFKIFKKLNALGRMLNQSFTIFVEWQLEIVAMCQFK